MLLTWGVTFHAVDLSMKAMSMAPEMFEVVRMSTLGCRLIWSS